MRTSLNSRSNERWILAFDASCCLCKAVANRVKQAGGGLEVMPLSNPDVSGWRSAALGEDAPFAPTLLRVDDSHVQAWVGLAMAVRLARVLGFGASLRLLGALGELRKPPAARSDSGGGEGIGRKQFLHLAGVGVVAALVMGRTPAASAAPRELTAAQKWVQANAENLPTRYADFAAFDMPHRKAIYAQLSAPTRSRLWCEHLRDYLEAHRDLTPDQHQIITNALDLAGKESTFAGMGEPSPALRDQMEELRTTAIASFGKDEARAIFATLGPTKASPDAPAPYPNCECNPNSDWCGTECGVYCPECAFTCYPSCDPRRCLCNCSTSGCGTLWNHDCLGLCD